MKVGGFANVSTYMSQLVTFAWTFTFALTSFIMFSEFGERIQRYFLLALNTKTVEVFLTKAYLGVCLNSRDYGPVYLCLKLNAGLYEKNPPIWEQKFTPSPMFFFTFLLR